MVSDRGPKFTSRVWVAFFKFLNVNIRLTSGYGFTSSISYLTHLSCLFAQGHWCSEKGGRPRWPGTRVPLPSSSTERRHIWFRRFLTLGAAEEFCNISWTGRGMDRRKGPGLIPRKLLIHHLPLTSTGPIRINRPLILVEDPCVVCLITSGAARRQGALS